MNAYEKANLQAVNFAMDAIFGKTEHQVSLRAKSQEQAAAEFTEACTTAIAALADALRWPASSRGEIEKARLALVRASVACKTLDPFSMDDDPDYSDSDRRDHEREALRGEHGRVPE